MFKGRNPAQNTIFTVVRWDGASRNEPSRDPQSCASCACGVCTSCGVQQ